MCPAAYCSRPDGIATVPPCGTLRASTHRTRGSPRCSASHSTSTKSPFTTDLAAPPSGYHDAALGPATSHGDRRFREAEALLGVVGDVLADRERRRRGGRGRVAHVDDAFRALEHEVVDQRAVGGHRLRAHAGP